MAETVGEVSQNMEDQLQNINNAKANVDTVYEDVNSMADKARTVTETSGQTAEAAQKGSALMETAIKRMGNIEKSVLSSADVARKLGENSNQIGQIVEAISSIAEQTNLLSLNAAIEAARAGEHGRGFPVARQHGYGYAGSNRQVQIINTAHRQKNSAASLGMRRVFIWDYIRLSQAPDVH